MAYCDEYIELISASLDGALSPTQAERLNAHLAQCPECRELHRELSALHAALGELPPVKVPADLTERIMGAVAESQVLPFPSAEKKRSPIRWQRWLASAAVLAVVVLGTWSWRPWERADLRGAAPAAQAPAQQEAATVDTALPRTSSDPAQDREEPEAAACSTADGLPTLKTTSAAEPQPAPQSAAGAAEDWSGSTAPAESAIPEEAGMEPLPSPKEKDANFLPLESAQAPEEAPLLQSSALTQLPPPVESEPSPDLPRETLSPMVRSFLPANVALPPPTQEVREEVTVQEALDLVAEYCFGNSGYETLREDLEEEPLSARFTLLDGAEPFTGGVITYAGEDETFFLFTCSWNDDPENPYHYSVHKLERYVTWRGEAPVDGELRP